MDATEFYEKFFQSNQWLEHTRRVRSKRKIKETHEVHILTPRSSEYISGRISSDFYFIFPDGEGEVLASEIAGEALLASDVDLALATLDEMENDHGRVPQLEVYIGQIWPRLECWAGGCALPGEFFYPESVDNIITYDVEKAIVTEIIAPRYLKKKRMSPSEKEINKIKIELSDTMAKAIIDLVEGRNIEDFLIWFYKKEHLGKLSKASEGYLLDGINVGSKTEVEAKIKQCMDILDRENLTPNEQLEISRVPHKLCIDFSASTIRQLIEKEERAAKLMEDMLRKDIVKKLLREGYICVKDKNKRTYKIDLYGNVFLLPNERRVCLVVATDEGWLPILDEVLAKCLFIRSSYSEDIAPFAIMDDLDLEIGDEGDENNEEEYEEYKDTYGAYEEKYEARKNASYDLDLDDRIIALSLEDQGERVN